MFRAGSLSRLSALLHQLFSYPLNGVSRLRVQPRLVDFGSDCRRLSLITGPPPSVGRAAGTAPDLPPTFACEVSVI